MKDKIIKHNLLVINQKNFCEKVLFLFTSEFEYMLMTANGTEIHQTKEVFTVSTGIMQTVKYLCLTHLFAYEGYKKAINFLFARKQRIPIYISETLALIPTERIRNYENIWVNPHQIKSITKVESKTLIEFNSGKRIIVAISKKAIENSLKLITEIQNHKLKIYGI